MYHCTRSKVQQSRQEFPRARLLEEGRRVYMFMHIHIYIYIYIYIYISTCPAGLPQPCLGWGCIAKTLEAWLLMQAPGQQPKINQPPTKNQPKIDPNRAKINPKSTKHWSKLEPNWSLNPSLGGVLRPSWPQEGPKSQKDSNKTIVYPLVGGPKWSQNRPKIGTRWHQNLMFFLIDFLIVFLLILVPTWPQLDPQNRLKIDKKWYQNGTHFFIDLLIRFLLIFIQF